MIIKNYPELATNEIRKDALDIVEAGFEAIRVEKLIRSNISLDKNNLKLSTNTYDLNKFKNIYLFGIGKGSARAVKEIENVVGPDRITAGHVIDIQKAELKKVKSHVGTHPLPSDKNIQATEEIIKTLESAGEDDLVIVMICGGGSALMTKLANLSCLEAQFISRVLLMQGAKIQEINTVRKHISQIHGGYFAKYAYPASVQTLIISDVPDNDLSSIASGPTVMDLTTKEEAETVAKKYGLPEFEFTETPKENKYFKKVKNNIIASGKTALEAMENKAKELGYHPRIKSANLSGIAKEIGDELAKEVRPGEALMATGETVVKVNFPGRGGRNQEVALGSVAALKEGTAIVSVNSDGKDNMPVAGAIVDYYQTRKKLAKINKSPREYLHRNNSYELLEELDDLIHIEKVTANVADFMVAVRRAE